MPVNSDSAGALHLGGNATYTSSTKYVALRFFFLRELIKTAEITIHHVGTGNMLAEVATKYLGKVQHHEILRQMKETSG